MQINIGNINALSSRLNLAFNKRIQTVDSPHRLISMEIPSTTSSNFYPRLAETKGLREWVGQRVINRLSGGNKMEIRNKTFEETLGISREDFEDDQFGFLSVAVQDLAQNAATLPADLIFELLEQGHKTECMDGQYYFDTDHTGFGRDGKELAFSNILRPDQAPDSGNSPAWYMFHTKQPMMPLIYQPRRPFVITPKTKLTDGNVFEDNEFIWGVDGRCNVGFGLHNFAFRSTAPLTERNLELAYSMMETQFRANGTPYKTAPNLMLVPTSLRSTAQRLMKKDVAAELAPDGKTWIPGANPWSGVMDLVICPWLDPIARND